MSVAIERRSIDMTGRGARGERGPVGTVASFAGINVANVDFIDTGTDGLIRIELLGGTAAYLDVREGYSGFGSASESAGRVVLGNNSPSGDDSALLLARSVIGVDWRGHGVRDESTIEGTTSVATFGYSTLDQIVEFGGGNGEDYDHLRFTQGRPQVDLGVGGTMAELCGAWWGPSILSGTVASVYGSRITNVGLSGSGAATTQIGQLIEHLTGAGTNLGLYVEGPNPSLLNGALTIGGGLDGVTTIAASGQCTLGAVHATGNNVSFNSGGGVYLVRQDGGAGYGGVRAYTNGAGATNGLCLNNGAGVVLVRAGVPTNSKSLQVSGGIAPIADNVDDLGDASFRFAVVRAGTGTINTSDETTKAQIGAVPDEWLDAWGEVEWVRYKFNDAVEEKGEAARWHVGAIAQRVRDAFAGHKLDALAIGLLCFDKWDATDVPEMEEVRKIRKVEAQRLVPHLRRKKVAVPHPKLARMIKTVTVTVKEFELETVLIDEEYDDSVPTGRMIRVREAGELWGLRYAECQAIEAAYQRRRMARIEARLDALGA